MDGNKRNFFKKRPNVQFKRKGSNNNYRKGKWNNSTHEQSSENYQSLDTVYRVLCPSNKIGGVIGKVGSRVKALREETRAKITVSDSVPGSNERVIIIYSSPKKIPSKENGDEESAEENEPDHMEPHCAAQDALLKVYDRIVEEDIFGGDGDNENSVVTARLLVPNHMVGCVLGKGGDVIRRLRSETKANIRVLPADQLPTCAMETDELVQISGKPDVTKRALYEVSTLLHQNPRKDKPPSGAPMPFGGQGFHPPRAPLTNMLPRGDPMWSNRAPPHSMTPMPWMEGYGNRSSGFSPGDFGVPPEHGADALTEFSMKILCSAEKIGGVIGKGGFNVKQIQLETGASIHVQDASMDLEERVIRVSASEAFWNPRSQTIEAILELQNKTSEFSDKGIITTRLLVPSSKVGCILGQGGQVINEMRKRTQADIRVYSKDDRPRCAAEDEELVQISGNFGVAKDALAEITSRLRVRTLRDANAGAEPAPVGPARGFRFSSSLPARGPPQPPPGPVGAGSSGGFDPLKVDRHEYELPNYRIPPVASGHPSVNHALEGKIPGNAMDSFPGTGGSSISIIREVGRPRPKFQDPEVGGSQRLAEIRGSNHLNVAQNILQAFRASSGQNASAQSGSYHNVNAQQHSYHNVNPQQSPYRINSQQSPYQINSQQSPYQINRQHSPYQINPQHSPYQTNPSPYRINDPQSPYRFNGLQSPYQLSAQHGSYPGTNTSQGAYHNYNSSQQGTYQYRP